MYLFLYFLHISQQSEAYNINAPCVFVLRPTSFAAVFRSFRALPFGILSQT